MLKQVQHDIKGMFSMTERVCFDMTEMLKQVQHDKEGVFGITINNNT